MDSTGIQVGATVEMKKTHPCGSTRWQVLMVGADVKLKCEGCGHIIMLSRQKLKKSLRNIE
ncbi:MAG: DUF951 domain-containing protein [Eubacteriales bacterium]|nr:DUF951 domain-containing protein [Eubacteriales bacterium]